MDQNTRATDIVTIITISVVAVGTVEIAAVHQASQTNSHTARTASVRTRTTIQVTARDNARALPMLEMDTVMTTIITVGANMMEVTAVDIPQQDPANTNTAKAANAWTQKLSQQKVAKRKEHAIQLHTRVMVTVTTTTTIAVAVGMAVIAAVTMVRKRSERTVKHVSA